MNNSSGDGLLVIIVLGVVAYAVLDYFAIKKSSDYRVNDTILRVLSFLDITLFVVILIAVYNVIVRPYLDGNYYFHIAHPMLILGLPIFGFRAFNRFMEK